MTARRTVVDSAHTSLSSLGTFATFVWERRSAQFFLLSLVSFSHAASSSVKDLELTFLC